MSKHAAAAQLDADTVSVASLLTAAGFPPISKWLVRWHKFLQFQRQKMHPVYRLSCGYMPAVALFAAPSELFFKKKGIFWPAYWNTRNIFPDGSYSDDRRQPQTVPSFVTSMMARIQSVLPEAGFQITFLGEDPIITCYVDGKDYYVLVYDDTGPLTLT